MPVIQLGGPPQLAGGFGSLMAGGGGPQTLAASLKLRAAEQRRREWATATQQTGADWQKTIATMAGWQQQQQMETMRQQSWWDREQYRQEAYAARQQLAAVIRAQEEQAEADYEEFGMNPAEMENVRQQQALSEEELRPFLRQYEPSQPEYIQADLQEIEQQIYALRNSVGTGEATQEEVAPLLQQKHQERNALRRTPPVWRKRQSPWPKGQGIGDLWTHERTGAEMTRDRYGIPKVLIDAEKAVGPTAIDGRPPTVDEAVQQQVNKMSDSQWKGLLNEASNKRTPEFVTPETPMPSAQTVRQQVLDTLRERERARRWTEGEIELSKIERELKAHPRYDFSDRLPPELLGDEPEKAQLEWAEWTIQDLHKRYESADQMPPEDRKRFEEAVAIWERSQK